MTEDPHRLRRFIEAQDHAGTYQRALAELRAGAKRSHWMWFVFPQLAGLGHSAIAREYAISSLDEAIAYLADPVLGTRLVECSQALLSLHGLTAEQVLGGVDALKLRSSMTLFAAAAPQQQPIFGAVLERYFGGVTDSETERRLQGER